MSMITYGRGNSKAPVHKLVKRSTSMHAKNSKRKVEFFIDYSTNGGYTIRFDTQGQYSPIPYLEYDQIHDNMRPYIIIETGIQINIKWKK